MARHGDNFTCGEKHGSGGGWSTQIVGTYTRARTFATRSLATTGQSFRRLSEREFYPYCLRCRKRMVRGHRNSRRLGKMLTYRCTNCFDAVTAHSTFKGELDDKRRQAIELLRQGYTVPHVYKTLHLSTHNVETWAKEVDRRRCECGQVFFHKRRCFKRSIPHDQDLFNNIFARIKRRVPAELFDEIREEIAAMVLADIAMDVDKRLKSVQQYIRQYKKMYPQRISLDADPTLAERLEG